MRVLVTGHLGYLGAVVTRVLQADGFDVVGLDSDLYRACTFGDPSALPAVPVIAKDIRDVALARPARVRRRRPPWRRSRTTRSVTLIRP